MNRDKSDFFNLGTGHGYSVKEVINETEKVTGQKIPLKTGPRREGDPPQLVADNRKAAEILKWTPQHSDLNNVLKTAWAWHQKWFGVKATKNRK